MTGQAAEREIVFDRGVMTVPLSMWRGGAEWVLNLHRLGSLGEPHNLPPDPNPMPRLRLLGRRYNGAQRAVRRGSAQRDQPRGRA